MTTMGVRQHLTQLEEAGLVEPTEPTSTPRGRPVKLWQLTAGGHGRFPDAHAQVTSDLIASVRDLLGDAALDRVIDERTRQSLVSYLSRIKHHTSIEDKLRALAEVRTEEGYMAEVEVEDTCLRLIENHCPICIAAQSCQGFCRSELEVFQQLFEGDATVDREDYLLDGARRCSYRVTPLSAAE